MLIATAGGRVSPHQPATAPPGTLEQAVGLTVAHALPLRPRAQRVLLHHLLGDGVAPLSSSTETGARFGISSHRVNQLVRETRRFAVTVHLPTTVDTVRRVLTAPGIRYAADVIDDLVELAVLERPRHVDALERLLSLYGQPLQAETISTVGGAVLLPRLTPPGSTACGRTFSAG